MIELSTDRDEGPTSRMTERASLRPDSVSTVTKVHLRARPPVHRDVTDTGMRAPPEGDSLLHFGSRSGVPACGYVRPSPVAAGKWDKELHLAEEEATRQAQEYISLCRDRRRALLPGYQERARVHYDWDTAVETFSDLSNDEGECGPLDEEATRSDDAVVHRSDPN